jgi:hypothetical protein
MPAELIISTRVQPSGKEDVPVKTVQIGADAAQTTRVTGDLGSK